MIRRFHQLFVSFCTLCALIIPLSATAVEPHSQCPEFNINNSWKDFIAGRVPQHRAGNGNFWFEVRFEYMQNIPDSKKYSGNDDPLGPIWKGRCYYGNYDSKERKWYSAGYHEKKKEAELYRYDRNVADVDKMQISIWGRVFVFDEVGDLFDYQYGKVGRLHCVVQPRGCEKYED